jgi:hypothetical protein
MTTRKTRFLMHLGRARLWLKYAIRTGLACVLYLTHILGGTLLGVLTTSIILYFAAQPLLGVSPLAAHELLRWFSDASEGIQLAIAAGLLTVIGIVAAYSTAIRAWKEQRQMDLQIGVADELLEKFGTANRQLIALGSYLDVLQNSIADSKKTGTAVDADHALAYVKGQADTFLSHRQQLYEELQAMHAFFGAHTIVLSNFVGLLDKQTSLNELVAQALNACYFVPPSVEPGSSAFASEFLRHHNAADVENAINAVKAATMRGGMISNFIRARLIGQIMRPRFPVLLLLLSKRKLMAQSMDIVDREKPEPKWKKGDFPGQG